MSRGQNFAKTGSKVRKGPQPRTPQAGLFIAGRKLNAVLCVSLAAATIALYSQAMRYLFVVWDDRDYVTGNLARP